MGLFDGMARGYSITMASLRVVAKEPWMIALPIVSAILLFVIFIGFMLIPGSLGSGLGDATFIIFTIVYFLASYFLLYFVQAMIVWAAARRFEGKDPTMGGAFQGALGAIDKIILLAIIAAIVGLISSLLSRGGKNGSNILGQIAGGMIGVGWTLISYFTLPIILEEKMGVIESFKRSWDIINKCWGEVAGGNASMLLFYIPGFVIAIIGALIGSIIVIVLGFALLVLAMVVLSPANAVLSQALYVYATTGKVPTGYEADAIKGFFQPKQ